MKIKATRITFLIDRDDSQWLTEQDLKSWSDNIKEISQRSTSAGHFNIQLTGLRWSEDSENGGAIKKVSLEIPLPKSEINKTVRDAIFALGMLAPMRVSVDNYTVDQDEFGERNKTNLTNAYVVKADSQL